MKKGFYTIIAAQFISSLADNALLIAAIALLAVLQSAQWMTPLLQIFFTASYVVLAPFVGAFADSMQKRHVMFISNALKAIGCLLMILGVHPMIAYGVVGFGAAAYSPAKYGILTELLPPEKLVAANAWIESATVLSTIVGTMLGGALVSALVANFISQAHLPLLRSAADVAMLGVMLTYALAAAINVGIPDTGARYPNRLKEPRKLVGHFSHCFKVLWADKLGQIALWVTTLLWGGAVTLQLMALKWANANLGLTLSKAAVLQGATGVGIAIGAGLAAARIPLKQSLRVLPVGIVMGVVTIGTAFLQQKLVHGRLGASHRIVFFARLSGARLSDDGRDRRTGGTIHRADERAAATSGRRAAQRRAFHRRAKLQSESRGACDAWALCLVTEGESVDFVDHEFIRRVHLRDDLGSDEKTCPQRARSPGIVRTIANTAR